MTEKQEEELYLWIEKQIDGNLNDQESKALEELILNDQEARSLYVDVTTQNAYIYEQGVHSKKESVKSSKSVIFYQIALAVAAALTIFLFINQKEETATQTTQGIAVLLETENCSWKGSSLPTSKGSLLTAGTMHLDKGLATVKFNSGATLVIEAPASVELIDAMHCLVHNGTVVAEVPEQAHGFTVDTPKAKAIDHGTKFVVSHNKKSEKSLVEVLEGEVEVKPSTVEESKRFFAGKVAIIEDNKMKSADARNEGIKSRLPEKEVTNIVYIRTSDGRGMDQAIDFSKTTHNKSPKFLTVKKTTSELRRKSYIKFDLKSIKGKDIKNVRLKLRLVPTEYGQVSLIPAEVKFTVYGVKGDSLDDWDEKQIKWDNAPANVKKGYSLEKDKVVKVGSFEFERSVTDKLITVISPDLHSFLKADSNELVTFIIVRESGEFHKNGYVHGFASKEHPVNFPPTLEFEINQ